MLSKARGLALTRTFGRRVALVAQIPFADRTIRRNVRAGFTTRF